MGDYIFGLICGSMKGMKTIVVKDKQVNECTL